MASKVELGFDIDTASVPACKRQQNACSTDEMVVALTSALVGTQEPAQQLLLLLRAMEAVVLVGDLDRQAAGARAVLSVIGRLAESQRVALQAAYAADCAVRGRIDGSFAACRHLMTMVRSYSKGGCAAPRASRASSCWRRVRSCCGASVDNAEQSSEELRARTLAWHLTHPKACESPNVDGALGDASVLPKLLGEQTSRQAAKQPPLLPLCHEDALALPLMSAAHCASTLA